VNFADCRDAGRRLSERLRHLKGEDVVLLGRHYCTERSRPRLSRNKGTSGPGQTIVNRANPAAINEPQEG
jgi:hypothetical protein